LREHKTGVRSLYYSAFAMGYILSVGYESYINVWSTEITVTRAHVGKLIGHNSPVVDAMFL
jgi:hypothetical protein